MAPTELKFLNALNLIPGIGPKTLELLKIRFKSYEAVWHAGESDLGASQINSQALRTILWKQPSINPDHEMEKLIKENIWLLTRDDPQYPSYLKEIANAPILLYGRGELPNTQISIAAVGTRKPTAYGLEVTESITRELSLSNICINSGLALGIDTRAHETALENNGKTIAVLGSGLDRNSIYPSENRGLLERIVRSGGTILSEYAYGTPALKEHFPQRNRIISGLSRGVIVIEAREKSGALITARFALEQNREVFAIPGSIFSTTSHGPNTLIQQGAKLITSAKDILEELGIEYTKNEEQYEDKLLNKEESILLQMLEEPLTIDNMKNKTGLETRTIVTSLSLLELKGKVRTVGSDTYQRT